MNTPVEIIFPGPRIIILGKAGPNLGDSMYDGTIFVGGTIKEDSA